MSKSVGTFSYPGGKNPLVNWIVKYLPDHETYAEPFGGSGAVLANKPESPLEVYNDTASLCVDFFRAVKHKPDELQHWVQTTPYSRELFNKFTERLQQNPPEGLVNRAGMFWYVQVGAFGGKGVVNSDNPYISLRSKPGSSWDSSAKRYISQRDNIIQLVKRFETVQIEHLDFEGIFEKYDSPKTVFYCDPPYVDVGDDYYQTDSGGFDHGCFIGSLKELEGYWLVSYDHRIPEGLEDYHMVSRGKRSTMDHENGEKTETLIMNYDPEQTEMFKPENQSSMDRFQ